MDSMLQFASVQPDVDVEFSLQHIAMEPEVRVAAITILQAALTQKAFPESDRFSLHNATSDIQQLARAALLRHGLIVESKSSPEWYALTSHCIRQCKVIFALASPMPVFAVRLDADPMQMTVLELFRSLSAQKWVHKIVPNVTGNSGPPITLETCSLEFFTTPSLAATPSRDLNIIMRLPALRCVCFWFCDKWQTCVCVWIQCFLNMFVLVAEASGCIWYAWLHQPKLSSSVCQASITVSYSSTAKLCLHALGQHASLVREQHITKHWCFRAASLAQTDLVPSDLTCLEAFLALLQTTVMRVSVITMMRMRILRSLLFSQNLCSRCDILFVFTMFQLLCVNLSDPTNSNLIKT